MSIPGSRYLRIGLVCPYSLSIPGGVQGQVLALARGLRDLGHEVRVLAPCDGPPPDPMVTALGKSIPTAINGSVAPIAPDPACALRTIHALRNERFDVLGVHEPMSPGPTFTALVTSTVPVVGTFHASGTRLAYAYLPWFTRRVGRKLALRVAVSEDAAATARTALGGQYEVVGNCIEVDRFASAVPWPKTTRVIFFLGRHEPRKGLSCLIEAVKDVHPNVHLWIGGTGPQTHALMEQTAGDPRIEWLGRINDLEKARRMRAADVFCAPSLEGESFGIVLLEAMAARATVVASDIPGYRKVVRDGLDARLFAPGDVGDLTLALNDALSDSESLVDSGSARASAFSVQTVARQYVDVFERAIDNSKMRR